MRVLTHLVHVIFITNEETYVCTIKGGSTFRHFKKSIFFIVLIDRYIA